MYQAKGGEDVDREQTGKLYETHYMRVFSYAMTLSGNRELAFKWVLIILAISFLSIFLMNLTISRGKRNRKQ